MLFRSAGWFFISVCLLSFSTIQSNTAESKTSKISEKKWAKIEGFRSAKFGMKEKDLYRAISKDFKVNKSEVKRVINDLQQTTLLEILVPKLLHVGGVATVTYVLGFKSKKLIQVNVLWNKTTANQKDMRGLVNAANFLRDHFTKKKYQKEGYIANGRLNDATTIVFRGKDKNNRMALLILNMPPKPKNKDTKLPSRKIQLSLAYILEHENPDVFTIKENDF